MGRGGVLSRRVRRRVPRPGLATLSGAGARSIYQSPPDAMDIATLRTRATAAGDGDAGGDALGLRGAAHLS